LYLSENKQRLVPLTAKLIGFYNRDESVYSALRTGSLNKAVCASALKGKGTILSNENIEITIFSEVTPFFFDDGFKQHTASIFRVEKICHLDFNRKSLSMFELPTK
jgi:predicted GNAT family N-acyltransferase